MRSDSETKIQIDESTNGKRLDQVAAELGITSRSKFQQLIKKGLVTVNGTVEARSFQLSSGDTVEVKEAQAKKTELAFEVVFEDDSIIAINKPRGVLMHARGNDDSEFTVADYIRPLTSDDLDDRAGIVHRLDRETSGVVVLAKTKQAREALQAQFSARSIKKQYRALVDGAVIEEKARFEWPIERHPKKPYSFRVGQTGKSATTIMKLQQHGLKASEVLLEPLTGRTHQLRVHMAEYGHPIIGDALYSMQRKTPSKLYLHAESIEFTDETGNKQHIEVAADWEVDEVERVLHG